jgi:Zn-dependent protease
MTNPPQWEPPRLEGEQPEQPQGYQPFQDYYQQQSPAPAAAAQAPRRNGIAGWLITAALVVLGWAKYALVLFKAVPALTTLVSLLVSFGLYTAAFGSAWAAAGLVLMILVHEMGHVVEIRRQGMAASAPVFIPFFGAAIFQRQHAQDPIKQAEIGIAGPIAGTLGATAAWVLYGATHEPVFLFWAWIGFYINLFNLIPFGMLDGGWILAPISRWFQVAGLAVLAVMVFAFHFVSPILLILVILGLPMIWRRFRNPQLDRYLTSGPAAARYGMAAAWLALVVYLGFASYEAHKVLGSLLT